MRHTESGTLSPVHRSEGGFRAMLKDAGLWDLVQMKCESRVRCVVRVSSNKGIGHLYFADGQIIHAAHGGEQGEVAALEILSWSEGSWDPCERPWPRIGTIAISWQGLLLRAAQLQDESRQRSSETVPVVAAVAAAAAPQVRNAMGSGISGMAGMHAMHGIDDSMGSINNMDSTHEGSRVAPSLPAPPAAFTSASRTSSAPVPPPVFAPIAPISPAASAASAASLAPFSSAPTATFGGVPLEQDRESSMQPPSRQSRPSVRRDESGDSGAGYRPDDFEHAARIDAQGTVLTGHGEVEELAELSAYVCRLGDLMGELLGMGKLIALDGTLHQGRCLIFRDPNGDTVALRPLPQTDLTRLKSQLHL